MGEYPKHICRKHRGKQAESSRDCAAIWGEKRKKKKELTYYRKEARKSSASGTQHLPFPKNKSVSLNTLQQVPIVTQLFPRLGQRLLTWETPMGSLSHEKGVT